MVPYDRVPLYHKLHPNAYIMIVCMHLDMLWQLLTGIEEKNLLFNPKANHLPMTFVCQIGTYKPHLRLHVTSTVATICRTLHS